MEIVRITFCLEIFGKWLLVKEALAQGKPVLGICPGATALQCRDRATKTLRVVQGKPPF